MYYDHLCINDQNAVFENQAFTRYLPLFKRTTPLREPLDMDISRRLSPISFYPF